MKIMIKRIIKTLKAPIFQGISLVLFAALNFNVLLFVKNTTALRVPALAVSIDSTSRFNGTEIINSATQTAEYSLDVRVYSDNTTGYQATMSTQNNETAMTSTTSTDRIESISQNSPLADFPSNTWGVRLGSFGNFVPVPPASNPMVLAILGSKSVSNMSLHQVTVGVKLASNLSSGQYTNSLVVSVVTHDYPPRALAQTGLAWRSAMNSTAGGLNQVKHFARSMFPPNEGDGAVHLEDESNSDTEILGWFDPASETFYYYTEADKVELHSDSSNMFLDLVNLADIDLSGFNTLGVTNMQNMFRNIAVTGLDLSGFQTENVTDMSGMFYDAKNITNLDLTPLVTSNVTDMHYMFTNMSSLTSINLSRINTSKVTNMDGMFWGVKKLPTLDLSKFDTRNVTYMSNMFLYAEKITNLDLSSFDTSKVIAMSDMFNSMKSLTNLKFSKKFNTGQVQNMQGMFANLMNIQEIDLSQADFDTSNVTNFFGIFYYGLHSVSPSKLQRIYVDANKDFKLSSAKPVDYSKSINFHMFLGQFMLRGGQGSSAPDPYTADLSWLHIDRGAAQPGYFTAK